MQVPCVVAVTRAHAANVAVAAAGLGFLAKVAAARESTSLQLLGAAGVLDLGLQLASLHPYHPGIEADRFTLRCFVPRG
jgi:hypothetical protein